MAFASAGLAGMTGWAQIVLQMTQLFRNGPTPKRGGKTDHELAHGQVALDDHDRLAAFGQRNDIHDRRLVLCGQG
jgi:hypothetical protein